MSNDPKPGVDWLVAGTTFAELTAVCPAGAAAVALIAILG